MEVELPVKPDRPPLRQHEIVDIAAGDGPIFRRPSGRAAGSFERSVTLATDPALIRLVGGLEYLVDYPLRLHRAADLAGLFGARDEAVCAAACGGRARGAPRGRCQQCRARSSRASIADGLVAFWPHARGNVC